MIRGKRGTNILTENIIFLVLNLVFLIILGVFLFSKMGNVAVLEEKYSKQIAMIINSAEPQMEIVLNMKTAFDEAENGWKRNNTVMINGNVVSVKLREKGGSSYSFFTDADVRAYINGQNSDEYVITVNEKP